MVEAVCIHRRHSLWKEHGNLFSRPLIICEFLPLDKETIFILIIDEAIMMYLKRICFPVQLNAPVFLNEYEDVVIPETLALILSFKKEGFPLYRLPSYRNLILYWEDSRWAFPAYLTWWYGAGTCMWKHNHHYLDLVYDLKFFRRCRAPKIRVIYMKEKNPQYINSLFILDWKTRLFCRKWVEVMHSAGYFYYFLFCAEE